MTGQTIRLVGDSQRDHAKRMIDAAPAGYVVKIAPETRNDRQNRAFHAKVTDCRKQIPDMARFSMEDCKLRFMAALRAEMRFLPELDGEGMFPVGARTSTLTVAQFAGLMTIVDEYGARHGVQWSDPAYAEAA